VSSPICSSWPDIYYSLTVTVLFLWGALSDEKMVLSFLYAAGPCQHSLSELNCTANCLQDNSSKWTTQKTQPLYCRGMFTTPLHSNCRGADHIENAFLLLFCACMFLSFPSNGRRLPSHCLATGLYAIIPSHLHLGLQRISSLQAFLIFLLDLKFSWHWEWKVISFR
jgi:hypothetical protein